MTNKNSTSDYNDSSRLLPFIGSSTRQHHSQHGEGTEQTNVYVNLDIKDDGKNPLPGSVMPLKIKALALRRETFDQYHDALISDDDTEEPSSESDNDMKIDSSSTDFDSDTTTLKGDSPYSFEMIRIRLIEVDSWTSLVSTAGSAATITDRNVLSETRILLNKNVHYLCCRDIAVQIPEETNESKPSGLTRLHHYLEVKIRLSSLDKKNDIKNFKHHIPIAIGRYNDEVLDNARDISNWLPKNFVSIEDAKSLKSGSQRKTWDETLAKAIADAFTGATNFFHRPIQTVKKAASFRKHKKRMEEANKNTYVSRAA